jgi:hypothetical protein
MTDPKSYIIPSPLNSLLASVCGFHEREPCEHCNEGYVYRRARGWSDQDIYDDALLYRDDREAWLERTVERVKRTGHAVGAGSDTVSGRYRDEGAS